MKKLNIALVLLLLSPAAALAERQKGEAEASVLPDVEMIDVPTAGILDYYGFMFKSRFYTEGGVLGSLNFGVMERLNLGASMTVDRLVGSQTPIKMRKPEIQVKFRFFDGGYYLPAAAVGYDGQGYYYDEGLKKYMEKGKGMYLVGSKEVLLPGLTLHGGLNVPDFDKNYLFGFLAVNYTLEGAVALMVERDNMFHSDDPARLNAGVRFYITPYFQLDAAVRGMGRSGAYENNRERKGERIMQMRYVTSF